MSTLQLSLSILGALVLALIVAYNAWTTRRHTPRRAQDEAHGGRREPGFAAGAMPPADPLDDPAADAQAARQWPVPALPPERRYGLDPLIDVIAPLQPEHPVSGAAALAALPPTRRAGSKPFAIEGLNQTTQQWETPAPGQRYQSFQAGVQLTNRMGALNEIEFSEFVVKTQAFADAINAAPDFPDMLHEVARARELDQFASEHDAQLTFMLRAREAAWSPGYVQQNATRLGFVPGAMPGRLVLPASQPGAPPMLTLSYDTQAALADDPDQSALRDISLGLDVAQIDRTEQAFARLRDVAAALCEAMDGALCDQHGQPLPAMAMEPIAADLERLYDQLDGRDLSAGSALARRLFS
ncbi:cell division protein FtsZ [Verminephrobacter eiseniae]|uniref:cell division protein FtsZ n=1 Tax=Verminephrobacter eiseniae TaxID=364317 RepID=UPI0022375DFB|nr:cell division protein FtsZ [Verminephrobacter eiseniae]MCW5285655.1 cell division protein FtsZ [Verminephrobacter eiseniae]MCW5303955.1 cell division protein FtsZ [Verminephrobacter eiseniae]MCW8182422.1 cell division protein FtsZ [Verminephrobacter eiseniae]MCW8192482.1 cell division protein FtsZ [Verminephrobacter eiseniae]